MRTKYVTKQQLQNKGIDLSVFPNAGPNPNITGMRRKYWGKDAYVIKSGRYAYKVPQEIFDLF